MCYVVLCQTVTTYNTTNLENGSVVAEKDFVFWNVKKNFLKLPNSSRKPIKKKFYILKC